MSVVELDISASPEALFRTIGGMAGAFWIDGSSGGGGSFMGYAPVAQLVLQTNGTLELLRGAERTTTGGDPLAAMEDFVAGAPPLTTGSAPHTVGYFAYDLIGLTEPRVRPRRDPSCVLPLALLARYDAVLEVAPCPARGTSGDAATRVRIHATSAAAAERSAATLHRAAPPPTGRTAHSGKGSRLVEAPCAAAHRTAIERALAYIAAGDVYQVNLAQRFRVRSDDPPAEVYLRLRDAQRVPFGVYLDCGSFSILCGSPERFLRVAGRSIHTEPIKGTRPRADDATLDAAQCTALRADPKERAEHVMIVDLERNDLGRSCLAGSVSVPSLMRVESFATLHHLVSTVRGTLHDDVGLAHLLRTAFPGGSITGAPKIRAAQVIAELEGRPREVYTGALAWFRGPRDFDSAIAIRTAVARAGVYTYHAGGGIVADSEPEREYAECLLKAAPFLRALHVADTTHPASRVDELGHRA
jgi:para-aminobenzoate synthetase component 1